MELLDSLKVRETSHILKSGELFLDSGCFYAIFVALYFPSDFLNCFLSYLKFTNDTGGFTIYSLGLPSVYISLPVFLLKYTNLLCELHTALMHLGLYLNSQILQAIPTIR